MKTQFYLLYLKFSGFCFDESFHLKDTGQASPRSIVTDDSDDDASDLDLSLGNKETFVIEVSIQVRIIYRKKLQIEGM